MEPVAAGHHLRPQDALDPVAAGKGNLRLIGVEAAQPHAAHFEEDRPAGGQARLDEVFHDLLLAVHGDRPPDEGDEVEEVVGPVEAQADPPV